MWDGPRSLIRETIRGSADAEGRHIKQSGGHGQFGIVHVRLEPMPHPNMEEITELTKEEKHSSL